MRRGFQPLLQLRLSQLACTTGLATLAVALWIGIRIGIVENLQSGAVDPQFDSTLDWLGLGALAIPLLAYLVFLLRLSDRQNQRFLSEKCGERSNRRRFLY
jgi:hypothetical protein